MKLLQKWNYSLLMLITYISVFCVWKIFPSRIVFLAVGGLAVAGLILGMRMAWRQGYFCNRVDTTLHGLVIADLAIESTIFEAFRLWNSNAVVSEFHNNMNFVGCSLAFCGLLGAHRFFSMQMQSTLTTLGGTDVYDVA